MKVFISYVGVKNNGEPLYGNCVASQVESIKDYEDIKTLENAIMKSKDLKQCVIQNYVIMQGGE